MHTDLEEEKEEYFGPRITLITRTEEEAYGAR
jgi:hypothetical protein